MPPFHTHDPIPGQNTVLRTLALANMKLGDREGVLVGNCLENNTSLRSLDISSNDLGEKTAHTLGQVLMVNLGLTDLNLSWNKLRPRGVAHLSEGLKPNLTLQVRPTGAPWGGSCFRQNHQRTSEGSPVKGGRCLGNGRWDLGWTLLGCFEARQRVCMQYASRGLGGSALWPAAGASAGPGPQGCLCTQADNWALLSTVDHCLVSGVWPACLQVLGLGWCGLQDIGATTFGVALKTNQVRALDMPALNAAHHAPPTPLYPYATVITANPSKSMRGRPGYDRTPPAQSLRTQGLVDVDLSGNQITLEGVRALSEGIATSVTLAGIRMDNNDLREEGGKVGGEERRGEAGARGGRGRLDVSGHLGARGPGSWAGLVGWAGLQT